MPNVLSPRDLVFRPDNMDETVPQQDHSLSLQACQISGFRPEMDLGRRLPAFSLHCRLSGFDVHFTGEIENLLAFFFSDRLFYYLR